LRVQRTLILVLPSGERHKLVIYKLNVIIIYRKYNVTDWYKMT